VNLREYDWRGVTPPERVRVFPSETSAHGHIGRHVLEPTERWDSVLDGSAPIGEARKEWRQKACLSSGVLTAMYQPYAEAIARGMDFAADAPFFVLGARRTGRNVFRQEYFLSHEGIVGVVRQGAVRTAYRSGRGTGYQSHYAYFRAGFDEMLAKSQRASTLDAASGETVDDVRIKICSASGPVPPNEAMWRDWFGKRKK
jgi:hypothetical protein